MSLNVLYNVCIGLIRAIGNRDLNELNYETKLKVAAFTKAITVSSGKKYDNEWENLEDFEKDWKMLKNFHVMQISTKYVFSAQEIEGLRWVKNTIKKQNIHFHICTNCLKTKMFLYFVTISKF